MIHLPPPLIRAGLTAWEIHVLTGVPLAKCEGFLRGDFKPNVHDRVLLTRLGAGFELSAIKDIPRRIAGLKYKAVYPFLDRDEIRRFQEIDDSGEANRFADNLIRAHEKQVESWILNLYLAATAPRAEFKPAKKTKQ